MFITSEMEDKSNNGKNIVKCIFTKTKINILFFLKQSILFTLNECKAHKKTLTDKSTRQQMQSVVYWWNTGKNKTHIPKEPI